MADESETEPGRGEPPAEAQSRKYDQAFFLDLAAKGKDAWNAWRRDPASKDVHATFAGIDFSEALKDQINFEGFEFGDGADFSNCKWRGVTSEEKRRRSAVVFTPGRAFFLGAFGDDADFTSAVVGERASATFGKRPKFIRATFGRFADFLGLPSGTMRTSPALSSVKGSVSIERRSVRGPNSFARPSVVPPISAARNSVIGPTSPARLSAAWLTSPARLSVTEPSSPRRPSVAKPILTKPISRAGLLST
jgi:hypothetical protein